MLRLLVILACLSWCKGCDPMGGKCWQKLAPFSRLPFQIHPASWGIFHLSYPLGCEVESCGSPVWRVQPSFLLKLPHACKCGCPCFFLALGSGWWIHHCTCSFVCMQTEQHSQSCEVNRCFVICIDHTTMFVKNCKDSHTGDVSSLPRQTGIWKVCVCTSRILLCKGCSFKTHRIEIEVQKGVPLRNLCPCSIHLCTTVQSSWDLRLG